MTDASGRSRSAKEWVPSTPRALMLRAARVTKDAYPVEAVVLVHDRDMKDAWCLATSRGDLTARQVVTLYGKRFTTEETFRDQKDLRFGMGLNQTPDMDRPVKVPPSWVCVFSVQRSCSLRTGAQGRGLACCVSTVFQSDIRGSAEAAA